MLIYSGAAAHSHPDAFCFGAQELSFSFSGWVEYAFGNGCCSGVSAQWKVPPPPSNTNDPVIGLFDSIQGTVSSSQFIIQAVVGWGCLAYAFGSCTLGGKYWYIVTEIKTDCCPYYSSFVTVSPGDSIVGSVTTVSDPGQCGSSQPNKYVVTATDQNTGQSTQQDFWCYQSQGASPNEVDGAVLELPGRFDGCSQLPSTTDEAFTSVSSTPATTIWQPTYKPNIPSCNFNIPTPTSTQIHLDWTPDPTPPSAPSGPTSVHQGGGGTYSTSATSISRHQIQYQFDWNDLSTTTTGWNPSGATASASHSWAYPGGYSIRVRATIDGTNWSAWSPSTTVIVGSSRCPPICS